MRSADDDLSYVPPNPEFVPGTPEFEEKRRRLRDEIRARTDAGEGRVEVEDWLIREGLDPGDATRLVDVVLRPPPVAGPLGLADPKARPRDPVAARRANAEAKKLREALPADKPVTDPEFAFAAGAEPADHVRTKVAFDWYLFRVVALIPILLFVGVVIRMTVKLFGG